MKRKKKVLFLKNKFKLSIYKLNNRNKNYINNNNKI